MTAKVAMAAVWSKTRTRRYCTNGYPNLLNLPSQFCQLQYNTLMRCEIGAFCQERGEHWTLRSLKWSPCRWLTTLKLPMMWKPPISLIKLLPHLQWNFSYLGHQGFICRLGNPPVSFQSLSDHDSFLLESYSSLGFSPIIHSLGFPPPLLLCACAQYPNL